MSAKPPFHVRREQWHLAWDSAVAPVLTAWPRRRRQVRRARRLQRPDDGRVDDGRTSPRSTSSTCDQVAGPIYVDGAEPGDTLQVELLSFEPGDWGWTANIPGFGLLADQFEDPYLRITRLDGRCRGVPARCARAAGAVLR